MESGKKIGWIGTGVMGKSMCRHLLAKGYTLFVYSRTHSKTDDLVKEGATFKTVDEFAAECDIIFLMVGFPHDVEQITFTDGLINKMKSGAYLVDHTTSSPDLAKRIHQACQEKGIHAYDAPVSGGDIGAKNGQLVIMCGGDNAHFEPVKVVMQSYSKQVELFGSAGSGHHTKMVNQITLASTAVGITEGLFYSFSSGLDPAKIFELISHGAASSFALNYFYPRVLKGDYNPGIFVEHFVKDVGIALQECTKMGIKLPGLELANGLFNQLSTELGHGRCGTQALIKVLEHLNKKTYTADAPK